ncbi:MAG: DUF5696 domain-containing protein [Oscillospiraceae bacterium]|nr:DUF5696 domain-containing protein [Oscillospiraceae bacterium]
MSKLNHLKWKVVKHKTLIAWLLLLSIIYSLGIPSWSDSGDEPDDDTDVSEEIEPLPPGTFGVPERNETENGELWKSMTVAAESDKLELRYLESTAYEGDVAVEIDVLAYDENGELLEFTADTPYSFNVYDKDGNLVGEKTKNSVTEVDDENDPSIKRMTYKGSIIEKADKTMEVGAFAVRDKSNGFIWWSNPVNASRDKYANEALINNISSPIMFRASNHVTYSPTNIYSNYISRNSDTGGYDFKNYCTGVDDITNGVRFNYEFLSRKTKISLEITLDGDSVVVTVPQDRLIESDVYGDSGSAMLTLSLLNSFGAGREGEDGYVVVPDGSGAVIEFDNNKVNSAQYAGKVYGRDWAISSKLAPKVTEQVYLPVFGIVRDKGANALVAIAEKGDENAVIRAAVSRQGARESGDALANSTEYNVAWFDFTMRTSDKFSIGTSDVDLEIYEAENIKVGDICVRYYPMSGDGLSYVDVAHKYRDYLVEHMGVKEKQGGNSAPFYMTVNGGTIKRVSMLGFPIEQQTTAATYSQISEMSDTLKGAGIKDLIVTFNDFNTASIKRQISVKAQYSSKLGGKKGFTSLSRAMEQNGFTLYPSLGFMEYYNSGGGYSFMLHSSKEATRSIARQKKYELAFGTPDQYLKSSTILSPYYFPGAFDSIIKSFNKEGIKNISLSQATYLLYSDFSRKNPYGNIYFNRRDTVQVLTEGYKKLNDAGISIMAQSANAYALPYVSHISDVPLNSSNYDLFDYDIPFYQIVISGLIPYSTTPFNANANLIGLTLKSIATGTPVHYEFMYSDAGNFNDSEYNKKFYAGFAGWKDDAVDMYKMFDELVGDVMNEEIKSHRKIAFNEFETVFANGKTIYINLNTNELKIDGSSIDLSKYNIGGAA